VLRNASAERACSTTGLGDLAARGVAGVERAVDDPALEQQQFGRRVAALLPRREAPALGRDQRAFLWLVEQRHDEVTGQEAIGGPLDLPRQRADRQPLAQGAHDVAAGEARASGRQSFGAGQLREDLPDGDAARLTPTGT